MTREHYHLSFLALETSNCIRSLHALCYSLYRNNVMDLSRKSYTGFHLYTVYKNICHRHLSNQQTHRLSVSDATDYLYKDYTVCSHVTHNARHFLLIYMLRANGLCNPHKVLDRRHTVATYMRIIA